MTTRTYTAISAVILTLCLTAILCPAAREPVNVAIPEVAAHNNYNNYGGQMYDLITGTGINGTNHPAVQPFWPPELLTPDTWTNTSGAYNDEWQSRGLLSLATDGKIGWIIFDMGETQHLLNELYMWNGRQATGGNADIRSFNLYYATSPSNAIPVPPTANGVTVNYDFASGGWTLLNTGAPINIPINSGSTPEAIIDLELISARYLGIEILTNNGSASTVSLAEVGITKIPPPAGMVLVFQ